MCTGQLMWRSGDVKSLRAEGIGICELMWVLGANWTTVLRQSCKGLNR